MVERTRDLFRTEDAERFFKKSAGKKYRPSNGSEGEMFKERFCYSCTKCNARDPERMNPCHIEVRTFFLDISDPDYPAEWQYGPNGQPFCAAFEERSNANS